MKIKDLLGLEIIGYMEAKTKEQKIAVLEAHRLFLEEACNEAIKAIEKSINDFKYHS